MPAWISDGLCRPDDGDLGLMVIGAWSKAHWAIPMSSS